MAWRDRGKIERIRGRDKKRTKEERRKRKEGSTKIEIDNEK